MENNNIMNFNLPKEHSALIKVVGVGGGGSNAVNHMFDNGIRGVDFLVCNTDQQALDSSPVPTKIQLGVTLTDGKGAGSIPEVGKNAAIENLDELKEIFANNTDLVFITAGMGGGTGTGAAPIIGKAAKEMGILTVGIVTIPFSFEGKKRRKQAEEGLEAMRNAVDTLLVINNDKLFEVYGKLSLREAFGKADNVLTIGARGIAEMISVGGLINVDMNDVRTVMHQSGVAIMGSASADGDNKALRAVEMAMESPLLNDNNIVGAQNVLLNITVGSDDVPMEDFQMIVDYIQDEAGEEANVIWGYVTDESYGERIGVTVIATGFQTSGGLIVEPKREEVKKIGLDDTAKPINKTMGTATESVADEPWVKKVETESILPETPVSNSVVTENDSLEATSQNEADVSAMEAQKEITFFSLDEEESDEVKAPNNEADQTASEPQAEPVSAPKNEPITQATPPETDLKKYTEEERQAIIDKRIAALKDFNQNSSTPKGLQELEGTPAIDRSSLKNKINFNASFNEKGASRFSIGPDNNLDSNVSFLHDNVD
jgi:cell division protein FtsZ